MPTSAGIAGAPTSRPSRMRQTPKGVPLAQAGLRHVHVALLEDAQRQPAARKEHGVEREERDARSSGGVVSCARPRWRTSTLQSLRKASARRSARYTERWRPPVQPIATRDASCGSRARSSGSQRASKPRDVLEPALDRGVAARGTRSPARSRAGKAGAARDRSAGWAACGRRTPSRRRAACRRL